MVTLRYGGEVNGILGQGDWERWWYMNCEGRRKDAALDVSVVNPLQQQLAGQVAREGEKGVQHAFNIQMGKYSDRCEAEGILFFWRLWESLRSRRCYIYTRWDNDQERILKTIFFTVKSILEWGSWWTQLPLGPIWHLQLFQLLFRYIEAGGIPSILIHYIALLFSTTICWCPLPFW